MPKMVPRKKPIMNAKPNRNQDKQQDKQKIEGYRLEQTPAAASGSLTWKGFCTAEQVCANRVQHSNAASISLAVFSQSFFPAA